MRQYKGFPVYELGTKVRLAPARKLEGRSYLGTNSEMEASMRLEQEFIVEKVMLNGSCPRYRFKNSMWAWDNSMIAGAVPEMATIESGDELEHASFGKFFNKFVVEV